MQEQTTAGNGRDAPRQPINMAAGSLGDDLSTAHSYMDRVELAVNGPAAPTLHPATEVVSKSREMGIADRLQSNQQSLSALLHRLEALTGMLGI